jgi:hypothetical protein
MLQSSNNAEVSVCSLRAFAANGETKSFLLQLAQTGINAVRSIQLMLSLEKCGMT